MMKGLYTINSSRQTVEQIEVIPSVPNTPFLYLLKTLENRVSFSNVFRGVEKGCIGDKWVNQEVVLPEVFKLNDSVMKT